LLAECIDMAVETKRTWCPQTIADAVTIRNTPLCLIAAHYMNELAMWRWAWTIWQHFYGANRRVNRKNSTSRAAYVWPRLSSL